MTAMLKDLEQEIRLLKEGRTQKSETMFPPWVTKTEFNQKEGQQWEGELTQYLTLADVSALLE